MGRPVVAGQVKARRRIKYHKCSKCKRFRIFHVRIDVGVFGTLSRKFCSYCGSREFEGLLPNDMEV